MSTDTRENSAHYRPQSRCQYWMVPLWMTESISSPAQKMQTSPSDPAAEPMPEVLLFSFHRHFQCKRVDILQHFSITFWLIVASSGSNIPTLRKKPSKSADSSEIPQNWQYAGFLKGFIEQRSDQCCDCSTVRSLPVHVYIRVSCPALLLTSCM